MCFLLLSLQSCFDANDLCRCINERTHTSTQRIKKQAAKKCMKIDSLALWDFIVFRFRIFFLLLFFTLYICRRVSLFYVESFEWGKCSAMRFYPHYIQRKSIYSHSIIYNRRRFFFSLYVQFFRIHSFIFHFFSLFSFSLSPRSWSFVLLGPFV